MGGGPAKKCNEVGNKEGDVVGAERTGGGEKKQQHQQLGTPLEGCLFEI